MNKVKTPLKPESLIIMFMLVLLLGAFLFNVSEQNRIEAERPVPVGYTIEHNDIFDYYRFKRPDGTYSGYFRPYTYVLKEAYKDDNLKNGWKKVE